MVCMTVYLSNAVFTTKSLLNITLKIRYPYIAINLFYKLAICFRQLQGMTDIIASTHAIV